MNYSKLGFLFLIFAVVSGGYVNQLLSCQLQKILTDNMYAKHIVGIILLFSLIMCDGGWSFKTHPRIDGTPDSWSNGNITHSLLFTIMIYPLFILSAKMKLKFTIIFYLLTFILYCLNTYRLYNLGRKLITKENSDKLLTIEKIILKIMIGILIWGVIDYLVYKKEKEIDNFSYYKFFIGTNKCRSL